MFVYVKNGNIIYKSWTRTNLFPDASEVQCGFNLNDNLIFEEGQVRIYEKSKQFEKDIHKYKLTKQIKSLEFQNNKLEKIANKEVKEDLKKKNTTKFDREIYLLKQMKQCGKQS